MLECGKGSENTARTFYASLDNLVSFKFPAEPANLPSIKNPALATTVVFSPIIYI